jgi:curved DNA-binding protein CbpA
MAGANEHESFDAFAVLGLPRQLSVAVGEIDDAWRSLSRDLHPDSESGDAEKAAEVNRARETLTRPASRLRHWLDLHGIEKTRDTAINDDLMNLFAEVGGVVQEADAVLKAKSAATSALGKALLTGSEIAAQQKLQAMLGNLQKRKATVTEQFPAFETAATNQNFTNAIAATGTLGFLEKWERQCQERLVSLISG